jgi:N6-L-threonylcarbamoyladenine synthase
MLILGIESSCDDMGVAVFDTVAQKLLSHALFSQTQHAIYGGVVPEIASRSQLEKIEPIVSMALEQAGITLHDIDAIAVTNRPGLVGSLLVGVCFAKGIAWSLNKKLIGINHHEGHIFSSFLKADGSVAQDLEFPFISLTVSGGHTALHLVTGFGEFKTIGHTIDDAAGEAFDKVAKMLGFGYPGGATIEKLASQVNFEDFYHYPRTKSAKDFITFSFSGLKTAVLYDLVRKGAYDMNTGIIESAMTREVQQRVASSLLVCIGDIFTTNLTLALKQYPDVKAIGFAGGVACNTYLGTRLNDLCKRLGKKIFIAPRAFCTDNGGMIAFVGGYKAMQGKFTDLSLDVLKEC